ncbi:MAG: dihydrolipoamide acetyltransferase family protein [Gammaproteobacteria bacterium]|nr:dihydrolipoamide acetyltransferase family protein [Gammaproteobacteria bacterium]
MSDQISPIVMPKLGLSMTEGMVAQWHVETGTRVSPGDVIADIETSKITYELEAHTHGVIRQLLAEEQVELPVGALIGVIAGDTVAGTDIDEFVAGYVPVDSENMEVTGDIDDGFDHPQMEEKEITTQDKGEAALAAVPANEKGYQDDSAVSATHLARKLARKYAIDLREVTGTGRNGRISKKDIERNLEAAGVIAIQEQARATVVPAHKSGGYKEIPLTSMRRTIAARLGASKRNAPHFRLTVEANIDQLLKLRTGMNQDTGEMRISVNDLLIRAVALALIRVPEINIQFDGDTIRRFNDADVAVAVTLDDGLMTPIIRAADKKSIIEISSEMTVLEERAKTGSLLPDEYEGGTFTLSNLGMFDIKAFDAIINPPQAAILAVGIGEKRRIYSGEKEIVATMMTATVSCDHRVIDGATGARFMQALKQILEHPHRMLL